jgi:hypothetical protein
MRNEPTAPPPAATPGAAEGCGDDDDAGSREGETERLRKVTDRMTRCRNRPEDPL